MLLVSISLLTPGCKSDPVTPKGERQLRGLVVDLAGRPLSGIDVVAHGVRGTTDEQGLFELSDVEILADRGVVTASGEGYFASVLGFVPSDDEALFVELRMTALEVAAALDAAAGGQAALPNGAGVEIPASAIRRADGTAYSGSVEVALVHLDPSSPDFAATVSGGDLQALRSDDSEASLYSYGILRVELRDPVGNELQLDGGNTSTIRIPVPPSMAGNAPATIPLWYLDEATGLWMEEGEATLTGNVYVGTVTHFTDWNCDVPEGTATVTGRIVDCNDKPVPNIDVQVGQGSTDAAGYFTRRVPANTPFQVTTAGSAAPYRR